jgi:hypothetical protein
MDIDNTQGGAEPSPASAGSQPVAYEVWWEGAVRRPYFVSADEKPSGNFTPAPRCTPLYRKPMLTNDEEEAIRGALGWLLWCDQNRQIGDGGKKDIATLRGLLERLA